MARAVLEWVNPETRRRHHRSPAMAKTVGLDNWSAEMTIVRCESQRLEGIAEGKWMNCARGPTVGIPPPDAIAPRSVFGSLIKAEPNMCSWMTECSKV